jgi:peptide/nickel transport system permease protein
MASKSACAAAQPLAKSGLSPDDPTAVAAAVGLGVDGDAVFVDCGFGDGPLGHAAARDVDLVDGCSVRHGAPPLVALRLILTGADAGYRAIAALRRGTPVDNSLMVVSFVGVSAPQFVIGILLLYVFAVRLGWFPIGGYGTFAHLVLPSVTLGFLGAGWYSRMMRSSLIDVLGQDYIRTARAKGLRRAQILFVHAMPNAILPIIAMIGIDIGLFISGIVVVESVFGWPGIGQLAWQAIQRIDIPIIMGVTMVSAFAIVLGNLLADLIVPLVDPRIKLR